MSGLKGFQHSCDSELVDKVRFQCSLRDSLLSSDECDLIWDFYVARSFASATADPITLEQYGWKDTTSKTDGYPALEEALADVAGIDKFAIIRGKAIKDTLSAMGLANDRICVSHPRAVLMQNFSYESDENEIVKIK